MRIAFALRGDLHRTEVDVLQGLEGVEWSKRQHRWSISLESKDATHREQFRRMVDREQITVNGHEPKTLAAFEPAFGTDEAKRLLAEAAKSKAELPKLEELHSIKLAECEIVKVVLAENTDGDRVAVLFEELRKQEDAVRLAAMRVETCRRRIASLEIQLLGALHEYREEQFKKLKAPADEAVQRFNEQIEKAYKSLWGVLGEALPQLAETSPNPEGFHAGIYHGSPTLDFKLARGLQRLTMCPQVQIKAGRYDFAFADIRETKGGQK